MVHLAQKPFEQGEIPRDVVPRDFVRDFPLIGIQRLVVAPDHLHPAFAVLDQAFLERLAHRVARSRNAGVALIREVILHHIPGQFMGELERLDQSLLFKPGERTLPARRHRVAELTQRLGVIGETLLPADIEFTYEYRV